LDNKASFTKNSGHARSFRSRLSAFLLVIGSSTVIGFVFGFYTGSRLFPAAVTSDATHADALSPEDGTTQSQTPNSRMTLQETSKEGDPAMPAGRQEQGTSFSFYDSLPRLSVPSDREDMGNSSSSGRSVTLGPTYILQVGSFTKESDAAQRRISILSLGFPSAYVQPPTDQDEIPFYRVIIGPFEKRSEALRVQELLRKNRVSNFLTVVDR